MRARAVLIVGLVASGCRARQGPPEGSLADLVRAAGAGNAAQVRQLLGRDPGLARASWEGASRGPVRAAARGGHTDVLRLLLDAGADPRERDPLGETPLHEAKTAEVAGLLLDKGVSPDVRSSAGETPLMAAIGGAAVTERLLLAGAHPNLRDRDGQTALHRLVSRVGRERLLAAVTLCSFGADPAVADEKGESARAFAVRFAAEGSGDRGQIAVMAELLAPGGSCDTLRGRAPEARPAVDERNAVLNEAQCRHGDGWACGRLGLAYEQGRGVSQDLPRAAKLYEESCEHGHAWGCYSLAYALGQGAGVPRDDARATQLFRRGCDVGFLESCGQLARRLQRGVGVARDEGAAVPLFEKACQGGEAWSCWQLGEAQAAGLGTPRNPARAAELRQQACAAGEKRACDLPSR